MTRALKISLAINFLLLAGLVVFIGRARHGSPATAGATASSTPLTMAAAHPTALAPERRAGSPGRALTPEVLAQLERSGISRGILIDVLLQDLERRAALRMVALQRKHAPKPVPDREMIELSREQETERIRALKAAFGEEGYRAWDKEQTLRELNRARPPGDELAMSAEETEQAYRLQKEFDDKSRELQIMMEDGVADRADVGALQAQAQQTLDRGLVQLLGQKRVDELRGATDPVTAVYRTFGDLNPTPDQAAAVVQTETAYREREAALARWLTESPAQGTKLAAELKTMNEAHEAELRRIFGAEAYDTLKRQSDPAYKTLRQYAAAWELKPREVDAVYANLTALFDQTARAREAAQLSEAAGQHVNWREVDAAVAQARQQTEAGLSALLGAERLGRLKQNGMLDIR